MTGTGAGTTPEKRAGTGTGYQPEPAAQNPLTERGTTQGTGGNRSARPPGNRSGTLKGAGGSQAQPETNPERPPELRDIPTLERLLWRSIELKLDAFTAALEDEDHE